MWILIIACKILQSSYSLISMLKVEIRYTSIPQWQGTRWQSMMLKTPGCIVSEIQLHQLKNFRLGVLQKGEGSICLEKRGVMDLGRRWFCRPRTIPPAADPDEHCVSRHILLSHICPALCWCQKRASSHWRRPWAASAICQTSAAAYRAKRLTRLRSWTENLEDDRHMGSSDKLVHCLCLPYCFKLEVRFDSITTQGFCRLHLMSFVIGKAWKSIWSFR